MALGQFLLKRGLQGVLVVWGVVTVVFLLRFITPGDPVTFVAPLDASQELRDQIAADLGLDQPLYVQYFDYLFGLVQGDMGFSYLRGTEASAVVFARVPATVELAVGISTPNFWLGIMLILVLSVQFGLFPTSRRPVGFIEAFTFLVTVENGVAAPMDIGSFLGALRTWLWYITLPAVTLGTYFTALITRLTRSGMLEELGQPYVTAARAKGLPESLIQYKHALRNTLIPIVTVLGLQLGTLIGGAVITEAVFSWPGLGTLVIDAINVRDWPLIQGSLIVIGTSFVLINIVVDSLYAYLNPRVVH